MKALICKQCGGQIDPTTYICQSCGTAYERPQAPVYRTETIHEDPQFATIGASVEITDELLMFHGNPTEVARVAIEDITHQLAEAIMPFVEIRINKMHLLDPNRRNAIQGTVRVKKPENGYSISDGRWLEELRIRR